MRFPLDSSIRTNDILQFILRGHMIDIIEMARFPAVQNVLTSPPPLVLDNFSAPCLTMAREGLSNAVYRIETNAEGFLHRHQGTWLTIRSCTRSALILLAAAIHCRRAESDPACSNHRIPSQELLPQRWREAVQLELNLLTAWADESKDVSQLRDLVKSLAARV